MSGGASALSATLASSAGPVGAPVNQSASVVDEELQMQRRAENVPEKRNSGGMDDNIEVVMVSTLLGFGVVVARLADSKDNRSIVECRSFSRKCLKRR